MQGLTLENYVAGNVENATEPVEPSARPRGGVENQFQWSGAGAFGRRGVSNQFLNISPATIQGSKASHKRAQAAWEGVLGDVSTMVASGKTPVVIFDLDNTSVDTRPRTVAAAKIFGERHGLEAFKNATVEDVAWDGAMTAGRLGHPELAGKFVAFWRDFFWDGSNFQYDTAIESNRKRAWDVVKRGGQVEYHTGRGVMTSKDSQEALASLGFPLPQNVTSKPPGEITVDYKLESLLKSARPKDQQVLAYFTDIPKEADSIDALKGLAKRGRDLGGLRIFFQSHPASVGKWGYPNPNVYVLPFNQ